MTQLLADGGDMEQDDWCFELELDGPAPPLPIYKKLHEVFEKHEFEFMHGDLGCDASAQMLMNIVTSKKTPAYTMDHFFLLCDSSGGPAMDGVHHMENEGSRQHLKLSLLGIICQCWGQNAVNDVTTKAESICNIMMQVMGKYPKELWNESASESGGYGENEETAWECVTDFFEGLLRKRDIKLADKKRFVRDYYLALKESHKDNYVPPVVMDKIGKFMEKNGIIDPTTGLSSKRRRAEG